MVGKLVDGPGADVLVLSDDLGWEAAAPEYAPLASLQDAANHPVRDARGGDHHLPAGVMALNRAAERLGLRVVLAKDIPPLPEGAVS